MLSRRAILIALPSVLGYAPTIRAQPLKRIAVVYPASLDPCTEAVAGLRSAPPRDTALDLLDTDKSSFAAEMGRELAQRPDLIVTVGSEALETTLQRDSSTRLISTMTLAADGAADRRRVAAAVYLDIPIRTLVAELRNVFPDKPRIGVIRNPSRDDPSATQMRAQGPEMSAIQVADCARPEDLLPAFLSLRKTVDFVICLPDATLYNGATARPLIMASLEHRLPVVGFSPAFLRAGAAVAIFPDYRAIGVQTADLVRHCLESADCASMEAPRTTVVAVNSKVLRMLGIAPLQRPGLVVLK